MRFGLGPHGRHQLPHVLQAGYDSAASLLSSSPSMYLRANEKKAKATTARPLPARPPTPKRFRCLGKDTLEETKSILIIRLDILTLLSPMTWDAISLKLEITRFSAPPGPGAAELTIAGRTTIKEHDAGTDVSMGCLLGDETASET